MRTRPDLFFQKIYSQDGSLLGIEILTRNFPVCPETDVHIFYSILEELSGWSPSFQVHVNIFLPTIKFINWRDVKKEFGHFLVVELVENIVSKETKTLEVLFRDDVTVALDDFGNGFSNFNLLREFPFQIVKVDALSTPSSVGRLLKEEYGISLVIAEKVLSYPADGYQTFSLHFPEKLTEEIKVALLQEAKAQSL